MGHLKRSSITGHLLKNAAGHLVTACHVAAGCWPPCDDSYPATVYIDIPAGETDWFCVNVTSPSTPYAVLSKFTWDAQVIALTRYNSGLDGHPCMYLSELGAGVYTHHSRYCLDNMADPTPSPYVLCEDCTEFQAVEDEATGIFGGSFSVEMLNPFGSPGTDVAPGDIGRGILLFSHSLYDGFGTHQHYIAFERYCTLIGDWARVGDLRHIYGGPTIATVTMSDPIPVSATAPPP